ncbi:MAG: N-formylglutamate amidohydrolase [Rhodopseudomonas sp.]|nr:N-formylglutamate amidohydrolase [Rhodopseudomonas sp.]
MSKHLLAHDEIAPVTVYHEGGASPLLLIADHAGKLIPRALGDLGVSEAERARHIGWDIGIAGVSRHLADALDAMLIMQNYSRLVIDCNRPPGVPTSMPVISELTPIPGNENLSEADRALRVTEIFQPYHDRIVAELERRQQAGHETALIAMHSFTPVFKGVARPWHVGLLYNRDDRLSQRLLALLRQESGLVVGDQEPYLVSDASDYAVPVHGEQRGLHHTAIEIRQDLIADEAGQKQWAALLARLLPQAYAAL